MENKHLKAVTIFILFQICVGNNAQKTNKLTIEGLIYASYFMMP